MGQIAGRRHRAVPLTARTSTRLQESKKAKADAIADTLGVSPWTYADVAQGSRLQVLRTSGQR